MGELDIVARDGDTLVFVEVKYRNNNTFGGPLAAVTAAKIGKLRRAAEHYLSNHKISCRCRFDVVAISGSDDKGSLKIDWIKNAF